MRYILIILVFLSVGAKAQMVIKAHPNYVPLARNPVLDDYSGAYVGYGVRKLRTAYTGNAIRVRKDTTGQPEQDIGFVGNDLDTAALKSFLNARSGFVTIWYDQSGSGRNATMTVQANQPRIALLGVIERRSGDIAIRFDGSNDYLLAAGTAVITISPTSFYAISSRSSTSNTRRTVFSTGILLGAGGRGYGCWYRNSTDGFQDSVGVQVVYQTGTANTGNYTNTIDQNNLLFAVTTTGNDNTWFNGGTNITSTYTATNGNTTTPIAIGARTTDISGGSPTFYLNGTVTELVIWQSNQTSNRTGIESNINSYYLIY